MSIAPALVARPEGLSVDRRPMQDVVEVSLPFRLNDAGRISQGLRLSRRHLIVAEDAHGEALLAAAEREVEVHVGLDGFDLVLPVTVAASSTSKPGAGEIRLDIVDMDERTEATLVQLVRTALTGWLPHAEDLARGWDEETPMRAGAPAAVQRKGVHWLPLAASLLLLVLGIGAAAFQIYLSVTTIPTDVAAVTAARYDIVSPEYGVVAEGGTPAGTEVTTGQPLLRVQSAEVEAALLQQSAVLEAAEAALPAALRLRGVTSTDPAAVGAVLQRDRELGKLSALQRRSAALSFAARCTCTVLWAAVPGSTVAPGALLMSLVVSDPRQIRIEALVKPQAALSIQPGQAARVTIAGDATEHMARVEQVRYQTSPIPKVGLGTNRDDRPTVVLALDDPKVALVPGTPVDVLILK